MNGTERPAPFYVKKCIGAKIAPPLSTDIPVAEVSKGWNLISLAKQKLDDGTSKYNRLIQSRAPEPEILKQREILKQAVKTYNHSISDTSVAIQNIIAQSKKLKCVDLPTLKKQVVDALKIVKQLKEEYESLGKKASQYEIEIAFSKVKDATDLYNTLSSILNKLEAKCKAKLITKRMILATK